ncbi:hypothetical protein [Pseudomonas sp. NPDC089396]|uniref:hypothetical protein n=1 Tax=Pseudomonas sp. NPDC089396 TaxID=3364461 RepID=UPI0038353E61
MKARIYSAMPAPERRAADRKPKPTIPSLNEFAEIDVEALNGQDLQTFINFDGIENHSALWINWRGADPEGEPIDDHLSRIPVDDPDENGVLVPIEYRHLAGAEGGWVFYSYRVDDEQAEESMRLFCYVGLRDRQGQREGLPVLHVRGSHDLVIVPDDLGTAGAELVIPAYQAMQVGDVVTLEVRRFDDEEYELRAWSTTVTVTAETVGKPLRVVMPKNQFNPIVGGRVEARYQIRLMGLTDGIDSPMQGFSVVQQTPAAPRLTAPEIEGHSGDTLDPTRFKDGVTIHVPAYAQLHIGDHVLINWLGQRTDSDALQTRRMDLSSTHSQRMFFQLDYDRLLASIGDQINLTYQYARQGQALASETLGFTVAAPREDLPPPNVTGAIAEGGGGENKAYIEANSVLSGATVTIPDEVQLAPGESFEVHWCGHPGRGQYMADTPTEEGGRTFAIPSSAIGANMEGTNAGETKRFPIFYRIKDAQGNPVQDSASRNLRIWPLPSSSYKAIQIDLANSIGDVSLAAIIRANGAVLVLEPWSFMAVGALLTIRVTGDPGVDETLRDKGAVTEKEMTDELVTQAAAVSLFQRLTLNKQFTVGVSCSFDEGESWFEFTSLYPTLKP